MTDFRSPSFSWRTLYAQLHEYAECFDSSYQINYCTSELPAFLTDISCHYLCYIIPLPATTRVNDKKLFKLYLERKYCFTARVVLWQTGILAQWCGECNEYQCIQESIGQVLEVSRSHLQLQGWLYIITTSATLKNYWKIWIHGPYGLRPVPVCVCVLNRISTPCRCNVAYRPNVRRNGLRSS